MAGDVYPRLAMVAGEASGDVLAALLLRGCRTRWPGLHAGGIGGPAMVGQGFEAWWPSECLAVRGYVEVLRHYRGIVRIRDNLRERLLAAPPDLFVGVDAPDFNLALEGDLRRRGIKTVHFVCPSIWAWRPERVHTLASNVDHVLCIFPFEAALLAQHGIAATYVGHPLAGVIALEPDKAAARQRLGLQEHDTVLALLPGSRSAEIAHLCDRFLQAAACVLREQPHIRLLLPAVASQRAAIDACVRRSALASRVAVLDGQSHDALAACDVALVASGTATLECALFKRPMVIAYHMPWLSWQITQRKRLQAWVGLPNILCNQALVPERLQQQATPQRLASDVLEWLQSPAKIRSLEQRFLALHHELLRDTAALASHAIEATLTR